jgi:NADPH-dependent ferric siderophore reductase
MRPRDDFRMMRVVSSLRISASMQRVRLAGESLHRFATRENLHVRLYIPKEPRGVSNTAGVGSVCESLDDLRAYVMRYYTIRHIDADAGWIEIDFVLHDEGGPGCRFGLKAQPGDLCGISGPCGRGLKPCGSCLLIGDDTALPAIGRICETLGPACVGRIIALTDHPVQLKAPAGVSVAWIDKSTVNANARRIADMALRTIEDDLPAQTSLWAAGELQLIKELDCLTTRVSKESSLLMPYWKRATR